MSRLVVFSALVLALVTCGCGSNGGSQRSRSRVLHLLRIVPTAGGDVLVVGLLRTRGKDERCANEHGFVDEFSLVRIGRRGRVRRLDVVPHRRVHGCADRTSSALLGPDGALLVSGWVRHEGEGGGSQGPIMIRFRRGGGLDDRFGKDGIVDHIGAAAAELAIASDGTITMANGARFTADGSPGNVRASVPGSVWGEAISSLPEDGFAVAVIEHDEDLLLAGFDRAGQVDPSFGRGGTVTVRFARKGATEYRQLLDLVADPAQAKLLVLGNEVPTGDGYRYFVYRFSITGRLDRRFGAAGRISIDPGVGRNPIGSQLAVQRDGKLIAFGATVLGTRNKLFVIRYTANGRRDRSFGHDGLVLLDLAPSSQYLDYSASGAVLGDGKLVVAGSAATRATVIYRLRTDGSLDPSFGSGGHLRLQRL